MADIWQIYGRYMAIRYMPDIWQGKEIMALIFTLLPSLHYCRRFFQPSCCKLSKAKLYFVFVFCLCILSLYFVFVFCLCHCHHRVHYSGIFSQPSWCKSSKTESNHIFTSAAITSHTRVADALFHHSTGAVPPFGFEDHKELGSEETSSSSGQFLTSASTG